MADDSLSLKTMKSITSRGSTVVQYREVAQNRIEGEMADNPLSLKITYVRTMVGPTGVRATKKVVLNDDGRSCTVYDYRGVSKANALSGASPCKCSSVAEYEIRSCEYDLAPDVKYNIAVTPVGDMLPFNIQLKESGESTKGWEVYVGF